MSDFLNQYLLYFIKRVLMKTVLESTSVMCHHFLYAHTIRQPMIAINKG